MGMQQPSQQGAGQGMPPPFQQGQQNNGRPGVGMRPGGMGMAPGGGQTTLSETSCLNYKFCGEMSNTPEITCKEDTIGMFPRHIFNKLWDYYNLYLKLLRHIQ